MNIVLLTGLPGVGKTTIVKRLTKDLQNRSINFRGFYTEEVRDESGFRSGFDVRTFDGQRCPLARSGGLNADASKLPKVGKYSVHISNFEELALPIFNETANILIIDEIGKMELLSTNFERAITAYTGKLQNARSGKYLVATIPSRGHFAIVEKLRSMKTVEMFTITKQNRDTIYNTILETTLNIVKQS